MNRVLLCERCLWTGIVVIWYIGPDGLLEWTKAPCSCTDPMGRAKWNEAWKATHRDLPAEPTMKVAAPS